MAARVSSRLWATGQWHALNIGHTMILGEIDIVGRSDYMTPRYDLSMKFKTFIPEREDWRKSVTQGSAQKFTPIDSNWKEPIELVSIPNQSVYPSL